MIKILFQNFVRNLIIHTILLAFLVIQNLLFQEQRTVSQIRREQSLAKLEDLKQRTKKARDDAVASGAADAIFACATSVDEGPDVLANVDKLIDRQHSNVSLILYDLISFLN